MFYEKLRFIHVCDDSGKLEDITITEDFEAPAEDFCIPGKQTVQSDTIVRGIELPDDFPLDNFRKIT